MGLFKKRATDPEEMERLKAEIASMGARLSASDQAKDDLRQTVDGLASRIDRPIAPPPTGPPPPPASSIDPAQLNLMNAKIERLSTRIDESAESAREPVAPSVDSARLDEIAAALEQLATRVEEVEAPSGSDQPPPVDPARLDELRATLERIAERLDEVDGRITSISTELANQINEMSGELESLGANEPATDEIVDELRDAQTRLASEQARYQIAFRQDLAQLADRLKRS